MLSTKVGKMENVNAETGEIANTEEIKTLGGVAVTDIIAIFTKYMIAQQRRIKAEQERWTALKQRASAFGVEWKDVKLALAEWEKTDEARDREMAKIAGVFDAIGIAAQLDMFEVIAPRVNDTVHQAALRGRLDCVLGEPESSDRYIAATPEGQAYLNGYRDMEALVAAFEKGNE
jgi:hypothetical protein